MLTSYPDPNASPAKIAAAAARSVLGLLLWPILLLLAGRVMDLVAEKRKVEIFKYGLYAVSSVLFWLVFWTGSAWVVNDQPPYVSFGDFVVVIIAAVVMGYLSITSMRAIKRSVLLGLKLESKEVLGSAGNYVGKVMGVDLKEGALAVKSPLGQKMMISLQDVERVGEKIVLSV